MEESKQFEARKRDHIGLALKPENQTPHLSDLESVALVHEALPEIDFQDISIETVLFGHSHAKPFYVSSMTAGHDDGITLNMRLAKICHEQGWPMGVGSQRRQLFDHESRKEWQVVRQHAPDAVLFGNLGIAQVIQTPTKQIQELVDSLEASAMIVHLNSLQECLQPEGTPQFSGGLQAISRIVNELSCPVIVKETGCGISLTTMKRLSSVGVDVIDVSGAGGTHWGRIEGKRASSNPLLSQASETFKNWGHSTVESITEAQDLKDKKIEIWASGGVRNGLDCAKFLALGASMVGFAKPALEHALQGDEALTKWMALIEYELKIAMFCTGSATLNSLKSKVKKNVK